MSLHSRFVVFKKERIGAGQFVLALLINLLCGVLLTFPSFRQTVPVGQSLIANLPPEFWVAIGIELLTAGYFLWPYLNSL